MDNDPNRQRPRKESEEPARRRTIEKSIEIHIIVYREQDPSHPSIITTGNLTRGGPSTELDFKFDPLRRLMMMIEPDHPQHPLAVRREQGLDLRMVVDHRESSQPRSISKATGPSLDACLTASSHRPPRTTRDPLTPTSRPAPSQCSSSTPPDHQPAMRHLPSLSRPNLSDSHRARPSSSSSNVPLQLRIPPSSLLPTLHPACLKPLQPRGPSSARGPPPAGWR